MEKKKSIWNSNPLRAFFSLRNIYRSILGRNYSPKSSFGFTLVELLVIIAIIGVLASSLFFALNPGAQFAKARDTQRKNDLEQIGNALNAYYNDNNRYPDGSGGVIGGIAWGDPWQPYMAKLPKDPLSGQDYRYESSDGSSYRLYAKLERCSDSQNTIGVDCLRPDNYSINSSNLAALVPIPTPTLVPTITPTPTPTPTPSYKRVFVSSDTYGGNLGGLSGADTKCQALASSAALGGTWKAWLSSGSISASSRLYHSTIPYKLVNGVTVIANNWDDLVTDKSGKYLRNSINKDQNGDSRPGRIVWTNTNTSGDIDNLSSHCSSWSSSYGGSYGKTGVNSSTSYTWTSYPAPSSCSLVRSLYCFEQ